MNHYEKLLEQSSLIEERLGVIFTDKKLLALAFVHRSFFNENRSVVDQHNERLEFLGDAVLGVMVAEYLYSSFPTEGEGHLSHLRSHLVEANACSSFVQKIGVAQFVLLGKGERMNEGKGRESILADLFEAIIGAIYLDGGHQAAKDFFHGNFASEILELIKMPLRNWKAELQDYSQKKYQKPPVYKVMQETGPDHGKTFEVAAFFGEVQAGQGTGSSKKQAEQAAAEDALLKLQSNVAITS